MAGRQQGCREVRLDRQTASLSLSSKEEKQIKNCSAPQQGSEGQTQQETMHSNEYFSQLLERVIFLNSWKIRFSTSLNLTNILNCSKKEFIRHTNYGNTLFCPGRASQVQISKELLGQVAITRKKISYLMEQELSLQGNRVNSQYYYHKKKKI